MLAFKDETDVPLVFDLDRDAVPSEKRWILQVLFLIQMQNVLPKHPKSRGKWPIGKVLNVVNVEARLRLPQRVVAGPIGMKVQKNITLKLCVAITWTQLRQLFILQIEVKLVPNMALVLGLFFVEVLGIGRYLILVIRYLVSYLKEVFVVVQLYEAFEVSEARLVQAVVHLDHLYLII